MPSEEAIRAAKKEARGLKKHLASLTISVRNFLVLFDRKMKAEKDPARGREMAQLANELELCNDQARYFGLHIDYRKDKKRDEVAPFETNLPALLAVAEAARKVEKELRSVERRSVFDLANVLYAALDQLPKKEKADA